MAENGWSDAARQIRAACMAQRVGRHVAWDLVSDPRVVDLSEVPPSAASLTPEFLTQVMCTGHPGTMVTNISLTPLEIVAAANHRAAKLTYNRLGEEAGLPQHLFVKSATYFRRRMAALTIGLDSNEAQFYNVVRPELDIETPLACYAGFEPRSYRSSILMNDLVATAGATFLSTTDTLSRSDIEGMLGILADVHGRYWASDRLKTEFTWLKSSEQWFKILIDGIGLKSMSDRYLDEPVGCAPAEAVLPPSLLHRREKIWDAFIKSLELTHRQPWTFLNGDAHLRNYYKTADGRVGLVDWEVTMKGAWSHDFAYTLLTALPIEDRRRWERELLAFYLERVRASGGTPPRLDEAWEIYRRQTLYTLIAWLPPTLHPRSECLEVVKRAAAAVDDLETLAALQC